MEELELLKKRVDSLIEKAYSGNVCLLNFLDEAMLQVLKESEKQSGVCVYTNGGIINADRVRAIISMFDVKNSDFKIAVFKINYNKKYYEINHRSILGSLMGLGIKRECIGDIVITDDLDAYFASTLEISKFIMNNLSFIGKTPIELEIVKDEIENVVRYEDKNSFVASLRLDVIIAEAYNLSRSLALEMIQGGLVYINHILIMNSSHIVKLNDEISVRHKGRVKLSKIGGNSRSGRICVTLSKRV